MMISAIPSLLAMLAAFGLAALLAARTPRRLANTSFALALTSLGVTELAHAMLLTLDHGVARMVWAQVSVVAQVTALPCWMAFSITLAEADPHAEFRAWRGRLALVAAACLVALGLGFVEPFVLSLSPRPPGSVLLLSQPGKIAVILALLTSVFVMFRLESALRNAAGLARWTIKYLVLGVLALCGIEVFFDSQRLLYRTMAVPHLPAQSALTLLSLGLIGFCVVRHRLLDVDVFVSRHVVFGSVTVGAVAVYMLGLGVVGEVMRRFQIRANFFAISLVIFVSAMALVIGMLSQTVRRRLRHTIATHFYSHRYDYRREWAEFTTKVTAPDTVKAVPLRILEWVTDTLGTPSGAMWLVDQEHRWQLVAAVGLPEGAPVLGVDPPALLARVPQGRPVILRDGGLFPGDEARSLRERALPVLVPVVARDEILGLLAVGLPVGGPLTTEDEDLLTTAGAQAATVVLNARLSEQLARAREIEAFHKLSSFIVHDLKNAVAMLSLVAENARVHGENPEFRRDAFRTVEDSVGQMRALIGKLSRVPRQSGAVGGRADLNGVVEDVLVHARTAADGRVRIKDELEAAAGEVRVREEDLRAIVANLVLNALDATPANGEVHLRTSRHRETVTVMVADTGCGMSEAFIRESLFVPFRTTKKQGLGVGLFQVKTIVDGVGGSIRVESREGSGTTFCVNLPAAEPSREE